MTDVTSKAPAALMGAEEAAGILDGHRTFYGMLARIYYSPLKEEEIVALRGAGLAGPGMPGGESEASEVSEGERLLGEGLATMAKGLAERENLRRDLNVDYTSAFYGVVQYKGKTATPYESVFRDAAGELYGEQRTEVFNALKRDALRLREGIDLPEDHLSFELQYLAILAGRAAEALRAGRLQDALAGMAKQRAFIDEHILSWIDDLADMAQKLLELDFYRGVLKATKGFLLVVRDELEALGHDIGEQAGDPAAREAGGQANEQPHE